MPGQMLSDTDGVVSGSAADPRNLATQMAAMLERRAQMQAGNPAVIHPATLTYRKVGTLDLAFTLPHARLPRLLPP